MAPPEPIEETSESLAVRLGQLRRSIQKARDDGNHQEANRLEVICAELEAQHAVLLAEEQHELG